MNFSHSGVDYVITSMYSVLDDAWYLELAVSADQRHVATAIVPDEDPRREPVVRFHPGGAPLSLPYAVMRWFLDRVEAEVRSSRAWMELRPELVAVIHALRQEHLGIIDDEDFTAVLAEVRASVPEADLPVVLAAAFERRPDGSSVREAQD
ncbi:hypothetical protein ABTX85_14765 [Streptomyces sp. NPDC096097]|uniref:hypothetical protein n=1 Tax=Streptomyces sp. NPDC096097 TaxID=3155546 RepID=UPI003319E283